MIISRDKNGVTIKQAVEGRDYLRIGPTRIRYLMGVESLDRGPVGKPIDDFTLGELEELFDDFQRKRTVRRSED